MTYNLNILLPEIFLSISIFVILLLGVFFKKSYNLVTNLSVIALVILILIILNTESTSVKIFTDSFIRDGYAKFIKILIRMMMTRYFLRLKKDL